MRGFAVSGVLGALLVAAPAAAHQDTIAHSRMVIRDNGDVEYALKIPVEDLAEALGRPAHTALDAPQVRDAEDQLFRHFEPLVGIAAGGAPCPAERNGIEVPEDERLYGELRFVFRCPAGAPVTLDYRVFFDVDPGHMGVLEVETPGGKARAELIVERPRWEVGSSEDGRPEVRAVGTAAAPAQQTEPAKAEAASLTAQPDRRRVSRVEEAAKTPARSQRNWVPLALVVAVAGAGAFLAARGTKRRA